MFDVNLSSRPFWNVRAFVIGIVFLALVAITVTVWQGTSIYHLFTGTEATTNEMVRLTREKERLLSQNHILEQKLTAYDTNEIATEITFLNQIIASRALSWSALLDTLEDVLPVDVRITSLSPSLKDDGTVSLSLSCLTEKRDGMLRFIDALNASPRFLNPTPGSQRDQEAGVPEGRTFSLNVVYRPEEGS